jgi:hypothetical protein
VAAIGSALVDTLDAGHGAGIVHRDVKPGNVMVDPSGRVRLADFGVASVLDDARMTSGSEVVGSPAYMAPEQVTGEAVGRPADMWALGATLYFAVEGRPPYEKGSSVPTMMAIVREPPRPPERAGVLEPVLEALLVKDPADRPSAPFLRLWLANLSGGSGGIDATSKFAVMPEDVAVPPGTITGPDVVVIPKPTPTEVPSPSPTVPSPTPSPTPMPVPEPEPERYPPTPVPEPTPTPRPTTPPPPAPDPEPAPTEVPPPVPVPTPEPAPEPAPEPDPDPLRVPPEPDPLLVPTEPDPLVEAQARRSIPPPPVREPPVRARPSSARPRRGVMVAAAGVALALLAVLLLTRGDGGGPGGATSDGDGQSADGQSAVEATGVPADWVGYVDPTTGFTISHPPGWTVAVDGSLTDFRDPNSGAYLRVDHVQPPGPSPEGAWRDFEPRFAAENPGYRRVRIEPTTYAGFRAAIWEYTYGEGGRLRAVDLGFVTGTYGFALNFQAPAADWERMQPVFEAFKAGFRAPDS